MSKQFIDPSVAEKRSTLANRLQMLEAYPIFSQLEFNILGSCNRKCNFCPVSAPDFYERHDRYARLKIESYEKLLIELNALDYSGVIVYSGLSEPLLIKNISDYIELTKILLPGVHLEIITNGDVLNPLKLRKLFDSGLDRLKISLYDGPHQIDRFQEMCSQVGVNQEKVLLRRRYLEGGNYGITLSNRSGLIDSSVFNESEESEKVELPLSRSCFYPFYMLKINHDGAVTMCSHDWEDQYVLGNAFEESVWEIWTGEKILRVRKSLSHGCRDIGPCKICDVDGCLMGQESYEKWQNLMGSS